MLFSQGADIIVQHTDSTAPLQVAEEQGKQGFGQASDMIKFAPKAQLTAIVDHWAPYYVAPRQRRDRRHLEVASHRGTAWRKARSASRPSPTCRTTWPRWPSETAEAIKTGKLHPFTGPITKQDGTVVGEAGKPLPDGDILGMNWYVKGVDDKLPQ